MNNNTQEKVVIITGASSGIGEAVAKRLDGDGAIVALAARRQEKLETVCRYITDAGGRASFYQMDVTKKEQLAEMADSVVKQYGRLDVLVGNAGLMAIAPLSTRKVDEWDRMIDINIKGILYGIAAAWPIFERQNSGHFINIASVAGLRVSAPGGTVYSATKYAVRAISEGVRIESAGKFRSTVISPGYIESELMYGSSDEAARNSVISAYAQYAIPAPTIADAVAYAVSQPTEASINEIVVRATAQEF